MRAGLNPIDPNSALVALSARMIAVMAPAYSILLSVIYVDGCLIAQKERTRMIEVTSIAQKVYQSRRNPNPISP